MILVRRAAVKGLAGRGLQDIGAGPAAGRGSTAVTWQKQDTELFVCLGIGVEDTLPWATLHRLSRPPRNQYSIGAWRSRRGFPAATAVAARPTPVAGPQGSPESQAGMGA